VVNAGCFGMVIDTEHAARFPEKAFAEARRHIADLSRQAGHGRDLRELHLMVYSGHDGEFTRITVPTWALDMIAADGHKSRQAESTGSDPDQMVSRYVDVDDNDLKRVLKIGPGLLLEVEDNGDDTHLLIWLE
jgi:hypothetical protein